MNGDYEREVANSIPDIVNKIEVLKLLQSLGYKNDITEPSPSFIEIGSNLYEYEIDYKIEYFKSKLQKAIKILKETYNV